MKQLPIGKDDFKKVIDGNFYYVDKTMLIKDLIGKEVVLYTRPRRFGKSLNMSMLNYFYNMRHKENAYLFDGLAISKDEEVMQHQNKYPVISITLKEMRFSTFQAQKKFFQDIIIQILVQYEELLTSNKLSVIEKKKLNKYIEEEADEVALSQSLYLLSQCLEKHYGEKVVILIDEYDVPLNYAYLHGYYDAMVELMRNVLGAILKTNTSLKQGILTGCLRIAKESIFTGLNNFLVNSITDYEQEPRFGFTPSDVKTMLDDYGFSSHMEEVKKWYDGYMFGEHEVYNPWSTTMYIEKQLQKETIKGESFWANTSGNDIVMRYIQQGDRQMKEEFDTLVNKGSIVKKIMPELTYREMDNIDNIYSFLLFTGYLKIGKEIDRSEDMYELKIPNEEVRKVYMNQFEVAFKEYTNARKDMLMQYLHEGKEKEVNNILNDILERSISYYDNKESFYHGFLVGLFQGYEVESNKESGDGRFDIIIYPPTIREAVIIIECKHSKELKTLIKDSENAAKQIKEKKYGEGLADEGYRNYIGYGISFHKKQCYVTICDCDKEIKI